MEIPSSETKLNAASDWAESSYASDALYQEIARRSHVEGQCYTEGWLLTLLEDAEKDLDPDNWNGRILRSVGDAREKLQKIIKEIRGLK